MNEQKQSYRESVRPRGTGQRTYREAPGSIPARPSVGVKREAPSSHSTQGSANIRNHIPEQLREGRGQVEYLGLVLATMGDQSKRPTQGVGGDEEESDYANLWDSESGSKSAPSFSTNQNVMSSILRNKGSSTHREGGYNPHTDYSKRNAMISSYTSDDSVQVSTDECNINVNRRLAPATAASISFDINKLKSLQDKVASLDLQITDFDHFSDLKHSQSVLELSKLLSSTNKLSNPAASITTFPTSTSEYPASYSTPPTGNSNLVCVAIWHTPSTDVRVDEAYACICILCTHRS